jgi:predicted dehydrogenase
VHVLCEKPLAVSALDARAMTESARDSELLLAVSAKFRFVDDLVEARRLLEAGVVGRPLNYAVSFCAPVQMDGRWNVQPDVSGGGVVMDNAPHALDVLSHVLDAPIRRVTAGLTGARPACGVEDSAEILFEADSGVLGRVTLSWKYFGKDLDYLVVHGTEGTLRVGWTGGSTRKHGEREWTTFGSGYDKGSAFARQLRAVLDLLKHDDGSGIRAEQAFGTGIEALEFIEAAYRSVSNKDWEAVGG